MMTPLRTTVDIRTRRPSPDSLQTRWKARLVLSVVLATLVGLVQTLAAQPTTAEPEQVFFGPVEVTLVNVDVVVTDDRGRPVTSLEPGSFRVLQDGEPMTITHFRSPDGVVSELVSAAADAPGLAPLTQPFNEEGPPATLVLFFDHTNLASDERDRAVAALREILPDTLSREWRALVAVYDGDLNIQQLDGGDPEALVRVLEGVATSPCTSPWREREQLTRQMQEAAGQVFRDPSAFKADPTERRPLSVASQDYAGQVAMRFVQQIKSVTASSGEQHRRSLQGLQRLVRAVAGLEGRKVLVYVSSGLDMNPAASLYRRWERKFPSVANRVSMSTEAQRHDVSELVHEVARLASSVRVALYPVTRVAKGSLGSLAAETRGVPVGSGFDAGDGLGGDDALRFIADQTGGAVVADGRRLVEHLRQVAAWLQGAYSLAYRPPETADEGFHRIAVEVAGTEMRVYHRAGYVDVGVADGMAQRTLTAAILGLSDNTLAIRVEPQSFRVREDGRFLVPLEISVPLAELALLPDGSAHRGAVSIFLVVRDGDGGLSDVQTRRYPLKIPNHQFLSAMGQRADFVLGMVMREGRQRVAVGVRDELGRVGSTVTMDLDVGRDES